MNTHPPLSLVCQQLPHPLLCPSHPFTPHSSSYNIYIDNINNNLGRLHPGHPLVMSSSSHTRVFLPSNSITLPPRSAFSGEVAGSLSSRPANHHGYFFLSPSRLGSSASSPSGSRPALLSSIADINSLGRLRPGQLFLNQEKLSLRAAAAFGKLEYVFI
jgi:hypothetical protein